MRTFWLTLTTVGLLGTAAVHLHQYEFAGYSALDAGWLFVAQAVAAVLLVVALFARGRLGVIGRFVPPAIVLFQVASMLALGISFVDSFFGFAERSFRFSSIAAIATEGIGALAAGMLLITEHEEPATAIPDAARQASRDAAGVASTA